MTTMFDIHYGEVTDRIAGLPGPARSLALLSLAQRYVAIFELFERRLEREGGLRACLDELWASATEGAAEAVAARIESLTPGETWVVGGFHDALAQYLGGVAYAAARGLGPDRDEAMPGAGGVLDALRVLLCEARLGCLEPADDPVGKAFEAELHQDEVVVRELVAIHALIDAAARGATRTELRKLSSAQPFDPASLEPALSAGLARDRASTEAWRELWRQRHG